MMGDLRWQYLCWQCERLGARRSSGLCARCEDQNARLRDFSQMTMSDGRTFAVNPYVKAALEAQQVDNRERKPCATCGMLTLTGMCASCRELSDYARHHGYAYVKSADGRQRRVPDEDKRDGELAAQDSELAGQQLDDLDRAWPTWAVKLPATVRSMPHHAEWVKARRAYVLGDDSALADVRTYTTAVNPPLALPGQQDRDARAEHAIKRLSRYVGVPLLVLMVCILAYVMFMALTSHVG